MKNRKGMFIIILLMLFAVIGATRWCIERQPINGEPKAVAKTADYYYCPMHPWFHQDHPGNCGICGMTLIKKEGGVGGEKENASMPGETTGLPESLKGLAAVDLSPFKQQLIGLRTAMVEKKPVVRVIRTVGRYGGGSDDFAEEAGDFAANGKTASGKSRYVVADIYALDIPYVKTGQTAWVSAFSGSGPRLEGRVSKVYPYDGTQSRVRRVRINIPQAPTSELFANVEIEAASQPMLSVPVDAVMVTGLHRYVFMKKSAETFAPQEVTVGFEGEDQWQVLSGLNEGETVVEGANFIVDADSKLEANFAAMESQEK
jgi:Cu(I)/Ag(I) efflux system membrane fusion protein